MREAPHRHPWSTLLIALVALGCGSSVHRETLAPNEERRVGFVVVDDGPPDPPPQAEAPAEPSVEDAAPTQPAAEAVLVDAGEDPMPLDYHLAPGQMEMVDLSLRVDTRTTPSQTPHRDQQVRVRVALGPVRVLRDEYQLPYRVVDAEAPPSHNVPDDVRGAMADVAREVVRAHGLLRVDMHGRVLGVSLGWTEVVSPVTLSFGDQLVAMLRVFPVTLPAEPIGVGGRFTVAQVGRGAIRYDGTATYRVVSIEGDAVELRLEGEYRLPEQAFAHILPGSASFADARWRERGRAVLNLGAISSSQRTHGSSTLRWEASDGRRRVHLRMEAASWFESSPVVVAPATGQEG